MYDVFTLRYNARDWDKQTKQKSRHIKQIKQCEINQRGRDRGVEGEKRETE